jgi:hypothetical protein
MAFVGINYLAVLVAAVAAWVLGAVWYTTLSQPWLAAQGKTKADITPPASKAAAIGPFVLVFVAELIMAWMLAGILGHLGTLNVKDGVISGAACWFGFVLTTTATNYVFQKRQVMLTVIDTGYWLLVLVIMGAIIGAFGMR